MSELRDASWPRARLGDALAELADAVGLSDGSPTRESTPPDELSSHRFDLWMERVAASLGCESEACLSSFAGVEAAVRRASPAIIGLEGDRYLAVARSTSSHLTVVLPGGGTRRLRTREVEAAIKESAMGELSAGIDAELAPLDLPPRRARRAREILAGERLGARPVLRMWFLRGEPCEPLLVQLRREGVHARVLAAVLGHLGFATAWIASWYVLGRGVFSGGLSQGWFMAWILCLTTMALLRAITSYNQSEAGIRFVTVIKRVLLAGAIVRDEDETAGEGIGRNLAYVYESTSLENNGLRGLIGIVLVIIELLYAPFLLAVGAGGWFQAAIYLGWLALTALAARRLWKDRLDWTAVRFELSTRGLDALLGQRTRRVQGRYRSLEREDDRVLATYAESTERLDRRRLAFMVGLARGWMVVGLLSLIPVMMSGEWSGVSLALSIGGLLFAYQALRGLGHSVEQLASSLVAWVSLEPILEAARRRPSPGLPEVMSMTIPRGGVALEADSLHYCYPARAKEAVSGASLVIRDGDRVLLEGASGSGKSTLAQLLAGHRAPSSGGLSLGGLDVASVGVSEWRRRVALVPQFHKNHVLMGPLALNLLLGRRWPPSEDDVMLAYQVCLELGLGPLLDSMPSGLWQMVGQTGWQLSHGERSRIFLARALLQDADVLIVDESLSALDPEHVAMAARCIQKRAPALVLIAHP
jgi:ATP-binding cassette subfamily B protein